MFPAVAETFANWNHYKSDVNETYMKYVLLWHISFPKKWGCEWKGGRGCKQISTKKCYEIKKISTILLYISSVHGSGEYK